MPTFIYSWNSNSESAKALKNIMGITKIKNENSSFKGSNRKRVINWGSSELPPEVMKCVVLNEPNSVKISTNKLSFFRKISRVQPNIIPDWTEDFETAVAWVAEGSTVCARTVLNGHSANGLIIMEKNNPEGFVNAPLYTKYIPKTEEYRVHVVNGIVIDYQRKTLKREKAESGENINWKIRNLDNGFIYQRENIKLSDEIKNACVRAMDIVDLYFGAVDVVVHNKTGNPYILEVNTAPGLQGTTLENYARALG